MLFCLTPSSCHFKIGRVERTNLSPEKKINRRVVFRFNYDGKIITLRALTSFNSVLVIGKAVNSDESMGPAWLLPIIMAITDATHKNILLNFMLQLV